MTVVRPRMVAWPELNEEQFRHIESLDRRIPARADLAAAPTNAQIATAINALYEDLRDAKIMLRTPT